MSETKPSGAATALIVAKSRHVAPIIPQSTDDINRIAKFLAESDALPKSYAGNARKAAIAIMKGLEIGWLPMQAVQNMYVINGIPTIYGDGLVALARSSGLLEYCHEWIDGEGDEKTAFCEVKRIGEPKAETRSFSKTQAAKAGLLGKSGPWQTNPDRMMQMRARAFAIRDVFADALMGLRIKEEVEDYEIEETPQPTINPFADKAEAIDVEVEDARARDETGRILSDAELDAMQEANAAAEPAEPEAKCDWSGLLQERLKSAKTDAQADEAFSLWSVEVDENVKDAAEHLAAIKNGKRLTATRKMEIARAA